MPLNLPLLEAGIRQAIVAAQVQSQSLDDSTDVFIRELAKAIDAFIRTGLVTTVGSSTTQTGAIT